MKPIEPTTAEAPSTPFTHALFRTAAANDSLSAVEFAAGFEDMAQRNTRLSPQQSVAISGLLQTLDLPVIDAQEFPSALRRLLRDLDRSPTGRAMAAAAAAHDVAIGRDSLLGAGCSYYYADHKRIDLGLPAGDTLESEKSMARALASLICGLRRSWHDQQLAAPATTLRPVDFAEHFRLMNADVEAVLHMTAWELRAQGVTYLWRWLLSDMHTGDIAVVFEQNLAEDAQNQFNGQAIKAAFNQWFACRDRINRCDHYALEQLDVALIKTQGTPGRATFATAPLLRETLQDLGALPCGMNYLAGCLFTSPWYAGFDDAANMAHLQTIEQEIRELSVFSH